jgi:hypothetical protein
MYRTVLCPVPGVFVHPVRFEIYVISIVCSLIVSEFKCVSNWHDIENSVPRDV